MIEFTVNDETHRYEGDPEMPLLWYLRENARLTGTKFGCGMALCGACTVHQDGVPIRSCTTPVEFVAGSRITTIEGAQSPAAKAVVDAWRALDVVQCGYCQSGQIMSATALLETSPDPSDEDIDASMSGNVCRCATYVRIRAAIHQAARTLKKG